MILTQAQPPIPETWAQVIWAGGTAGLIVFLLLTVLAFTRGWVVSGSSHREAIEQRDDRINQLDADYREMSLFLRDKVTPLLSKTQETLAKLLEQQQRDEWKREQ